MSFHEQNLEAFIELLNDKRSRLFSEQDRASLAKLIDPLPDDIEKLSVALAAWYEKRPKILDAQLALLNNLFNAPTTFNRVSDSQVGTPPNSEYQVNKQALQKAIQPSSPSRNSPSSPTSKLIISPQEPKR